MEGALDLPPMDLKASAEHEVRKLQDMVKKLERQNELLRHTQNGAFGGVAQKREGLDLEDVTLINLNDSADDLEDSWLYESPVKQATPTQKSITSSKWAKTVTTEGLDDVRKSLIDKLDDIEAQQEINKVRTYQRPEGRISSLSTAKDSLFFQPTNKVTLAKGKTGVMQVESEGKQLKSEESLLDSSQLDTSSHGSTEDLDDEPQGPVLRRSALAKEGDSKNELVRPRKTPSQPGSNSPLEVRRLANTSTGMRTTASPPADDNLRIQPRSRRTPFVGVENNGKDRDTPDTSFQSSLEGLEDDSNVKSPIVKRSALALPKPSSEGLSKQLWYSGPVNQMNRQKTKTDTVVRIRRSASPSPDSRSKLQPRSTAAGRRSAGSRGSMEDLLDVDDNAPVQRRSSANVPTDSNTTRSRLAKSDESISSRTQLMPRGMAQNLQGPTNQGTIVTRRSLLTPPSSGSNSPKNSRIAVARRKAPSQMPSDVNLDDSWKDDCY